MGSAEAVLVHSLSLLAKRELGPPCASFLEPTTDGAGSGWRDTPFPSRLVPSVGSSRIS